MNSEEGQFPYWKKLVILLFLGWVVLWIYRTFLTPIYPDVINTVGPHNNTQIGMIASIYFFSYALLQIPAGIISDKFDKKIIVTLGFIMFAIAVLVISYTSSLEVIYIASALAGLSGAVYYGAAFSLSSENIPQGKKNVANAIINSGSSLGMILGLTSSSYFVGSLGFDWQKLMLLISAFVLVIAGLFFLQIKSTTVKNTSNSNELSEKISTNTSDNSVGASNYFTIQKIGAYFAAFASCYAYFLVISWLPTFLQQDRHFEGSAGGFIASLVAVAAIPGALAFSFIADKFGKYKTRMMIFLLISASVMLYIVSSSQDHLVIIAGLIGYGFLGKLALDPLLISYVSDHSNRKKMATSLSVYNFFGMTSSFIAPYVTGVISDRNNTMQDAFYLACCILIIGAVALFVTTKYGIKKEFKI